MPTELEELVGFIGHANPTIRLAAAEHLAAYSASDRTLFKAEDLKPIRNLKVLIQDEPKIAEHVVTMLINLSADEDVVENLASDDSFLKIVFDKVAKPTEPHADLITMLLANLSKSPSLSRIVSFESSSPPPTTLPCSENHAGKVLAQLLSLFVHGSERAYNPHAAFHHLAYLFADLCKHDQVRTFLLAPPSPSADDSDAPLASLKIFTEHPSSVRRRGVASVLKNTAFHLPSHPSLLSPDGLDILPYVLLPLADGSKDSYSDEESESMLPDLQLLPPDKKREPEADILVTHLDTLLLLSTTRGGREALREAGAYYVVRETHRAVEHDEVRHACDRLVQVLMRDEAPEKDEEEGHQRELDKEVGKKTTEDGAAEAGNYGARISSGHKEEGEDDDDLRIVEV